MFKGLVKLVAMQMLQKWMNPPAAGAPSAPHRAPIHPNVQQIKALAIRYATFSVLTLLNFMLLVGGVIVTAVAIAHSFDVYNQFQATAVFWTGLIITFTAMILGGLCGYALISTKVTADDIIVHEPVTEEEPLTVTDRFLRPVFEGMLEGLIRRRAKSAGESRHDYPAA